MPKVSLQEIHRAFSIFPAQIDQLQSRGILPRERRGEATAAYIFALAEYRSRYGNLTTAAETLLASVKRGEDLRA